MSFSTFSTTATVWPGASDDAAVGVGTQVLLLWALLWCLSLFIDPQWLASLGLSLNAHGHTHLHAHGHPFVDARSWGGIPNTLDVLSNLPMLGVGLWGVGRIHLTVPRTSLARRPAMLAFVGLVLTWAGSTVYHWYPAPATLVLDRLGMAVTFAGVLGWAVAERLQVVWAFRLAWCVMVAGSVSAALPLWGGQVMPWAVLQFGGLALVLAHAALTLRERADRWSFNSPWLALVGFYVLAKWLELQDEQIFIWTHLQIAGHTLKHLAAACALLPLALSITDCGKMPSQQAFDRNAI
ncbi:hypothetical protein B9Z51_16915 [Limnohabitans sp. T6-5]|uniref:hypothetical protein n=1 Tax=Limnohabitans sp. T6-5 TaxID=1100724 RepID=UPI000D349AEA|nr:hypothetical protein [Limnohabitans sp. T6-5]PUE06476.1 hypothetical protein B9Z51_16915 [Limnohabitans sp. T6-5]